MRTTYREKEGGREICYDDEGSKYYEARQWTSSTVKTRAARKRQQRLSLVYLLQEVKAY